MPPSHREQRRIEAEALVARRTIRRYFAGEPLRGASRTRIEEAMTCLGLDHLRVGRVEIAATRGVDDSADDPGGRPSSGRP